MTGWRLVCDVGGTNIRIARCEGPKKLVNVTVRPTAQCSSLQDALLEYLRVFDDRDSVLGAAIAAAGPVEKGRVTLTNHHTTIDREAMMAGLGGRPVALLNDIEATAYAIPLLQLLGVRVWAMDLKEEAGFGNLEKIGVYEGPTLIIHAEHDHIIPFADGEALWEASSAADKKLLQIPGANHNDIFLHGIREYFDSIKSLAEMVKKRGD